MTSLDWTTLKHLFKAHPWHGVSIGSDAPTRVNAYIEMVPTDSVKYEIDKVTGHLKLDRPQRYSSRSPSLYGFLPQTFCGSRVGAYCESKTGRTGIHGDGDPLDICVLSERPVSHGDILVQAIPIGGMRMLDQDQSDDKIVAVLAGDLIYGGWTSIKNCPQNVIERIRHYFLTYKDIPGAPDRKAEITHVFDADEAYEIIRLSREDYAEKFSEILEAQQRLSEEKAS
ncbi:MAG: inorganic pyrophosphatase [Bdellovibrionota bacterium]